MIDAKSWALHMGALGDRFGRKLQPPTLAMYYKALGHLSTEQFEAAAQHVFESQRFNAWPAPQAFLDAVALPDTTPSPHLAFDRVYSLCATTRAYGKRWDELEAEVLAECGPAAARAARGLRSRWARHDESELPFLRRDFVAEYALATSYEAQSEQVERLLPGTLARLLADPRAKVARLHSGASDERVAAAADAGRTEAA